MHGTPQTPDTGGTAEQAATQEPGLVPRWRLDAMRAAMTTSLHLASSVLRDEEEGYLGEEGRYEALVNLVQELAAGLHKGVQP